MKLRHTRLRTDHLRVQLTNDQLKSVAQSTAEVDALLYNDTQPKDVPILLFTGAKAYCRGGGWWDIMGYAYDGMDIERVLSKLNAEPQNSVNAQGSRSK